MNFERGNAKVEIGVYLERIVFTFKLFHKIMAFRFPIFQRKAYPFRFPHSALRFYHESLALPPSAFRTPIFTPKAWPFCLPLSAFLARANVTSAFRFPVSAFLARAIITSAFRFPHSDLSIIQPKNNYE